MVAPGREASVLAALALALLAFGPVHETGAQTPPGPRFRADGPDADAYGRARGYPSCDALTYIRELGCRVGAFSRFDELFPSRAIAAPRAPSPLRRAEREPAIRYSYNGESRTLDRYLDTQPVTGLLVAQGDTILVERYQYARTDKDRLTSFSMAKTIIGLLIGIALEEGAIASIDDPADAYVARLKGTEFGRTPIKALLQMASGVSFREVYTDPNSDIYTLARYSLGQDPGGSLVGLKAFNTRYAAPGERFSYSSADSLVLGLVLTAATKRSVADYASEKLWRKLGAEADASWAIDATGQEITYAYVNAVLRDWARLGLMLAHDGEWNGQRIVPRSFVLAATTIGPDSPLWSPSMTPGKPAPGYGYQIWLLPGERRTFALRGLRGQFVIVEPNSRLVLVQTSLTEGDYQELLALWAGLAAGLR